MRTKFNKCTLNRINISDPTRKLYKLCVKNNSDLGQRDDKSIICLAQFA